MCITKYVIYLSYVLYTRDGTISVENKTLYCLYEWNDMKNKTLNKNYIHTYILLYYKDFIQSSALVSIHVRGYVCLSVFFRRLCFFFAKDVEQVAFLNA